jgi:hypothetical protein
MRGPAHKSFGRAVPLRRIRPQQRVAHINKDTTGASRARMVQGSTGQKAGRRNAQWNGARRIHG